MLLQMRDRRQLKTPPAAGPSLVEWIATTAFSPEAGSVKRWMPSWSSKSGKPQLLVMGSLCAMSEDGGATDGT